MGKVVGTDGEAIKKMCEFFGQNYGYVFLGYGVGGTIGPMLGGYFGDTNNFLMAFIITGIMNLFAAVIISTARIPTKPEEPLATAEVPLATTIPDTATSSN